MDGWMEDEASKQARSSSPSRSQISQPDTRWKALDEIYQICFLFLEWTTPRAIYQMYKHPLEEKNRIWKWDTDSNMYTVTCVLWEKITYFENEVHSLHLANFKLAIKFRDFSAGLKTFSSNLNVVFSQKIFLFSLQFWWTCVGILRIFFKLL